ncbi:MAG: 5'-3' exonuclease, partial [Minisyncoccales bacterium]
MLFDFFSNPLFKKKKNSNFEIVLLKLKMKKKKLIIFDSNAVLYRSFFALPELTTKKGEKIQAVYGFFRLLLKIFKELKPNFLIFCFDFPAKTFRHYQLKEYKEKREKMPSELQTQVQKIKKILSENNFYILEKEGLEADDLIASLVKDEKTKDLEKIIVTKDRDLFQLIDEQTKIYFLESKGKKEMILDQERIKNEYQIEPSLLADLKSLIGDRSDNIQGIRGMGKKTAIEIIKKTGRLKDFFQNQDFWKLTEKERLLILKNQDLILRNFSLINLEPSKEVEFFLDKGLLNDEKIKSLKEIFIQLNFKSLLNELNKINNF